MTDKAVGSEPSNLPNAWERKDAWKKIKESRRTNRNNSLRVVVSNGRSS